MICFRSTQKNGSRAGMSVTIERNKNNVRSKKKTIFFLAFDMAKYVSNIYQNEFLLKWIYGSWPKKQDLCEKSNYVLLL